MPLLDISSCVWVTLPGRAQVTDIVRRFQKTPQQQDFPYFRQVSQVNDTWRDALMQRLLSWSHRSKEKKKAMSSNLDSSLTSMDWLPQLGISSLRSGRERRRSGERDRKKDRGRERGDILPSVPDPSSSSSKGKPPHSYATLIAMAIAAAPERKLSLNDIYTWISNTFPYYSRAGRGWKVGFTDITWRATCARSSN